MSAINRALEFFHSSLEEEDADFSLFLAAGPISIFCTLLVGLQHRGNVDLALLAIAGTIFCMKGRMRGWVYSAILLGISALLKHAFFIETHHLWQLGVEGSLLVGFAITAAAIDWLHNREKNFLAQADGREKTIRNLEDDVAKIRQDAVNEQIVLQDRLAQLQKDFDENATEISSLRVLNDVLRKTTAATNRECEEIAQKLHEKESLAISLTQEIESQKSNAALLQEKLAAQGIDIRRLQEKIQTAAELIAQRDQSINALQEELHGPQAILLKKQATDREAELNRLQSQMQSTAEQIVQRDQAIQLLQERLQAAAQKEALFQELRKQFDEKNQILHQTRAELFQANTTLDALRLEQEHQKSTEISDVEKILSNELASSEQERLGLEQENERLLDLISLLSKEPAEMAEELPKKMPRKRRKKTEDIANAANQNPVQLTIEPVSD